MGAELFVAFSVSHKRWLWLYFWCFVFLFLQYSRSPKLPQALRQEPLCFFLEKHFCLSTDQVFCLSKRRLLLSFLYQV